MLLTTQMIEYGSDLYPWFDPKPLWDFWIGVERWHGDRSSGSSLRLEAEYRLAFSEHHRLFNASDEGIAWSSMAMSFEPLVASTMCGVKIIPTEAARSIAKVSDGCLPSELEPHRDPSTQAATKVRTSDAVAERPDPAATFRGLAQAIRRDHPRQGKVPRLLDLMADMDEVDFETIARVANESNVDDEAVRDTIKSTRKVIVKANLPFKLVVSRRRLFKRSLPS